MMPSAKHHRISRSSASYARTFAPAQPVSSSVTPCTVRITWGTPASFAAMVPKTLSL